MTKKQRAYFDLLVSFGFYGAAVVYAANIMLGPELASKIIRKRR